MIRLCPDGWYASSVTQRPHGRTKRVLATVAGRVALLPEAAEKPGSAGLKFRQPGLLLLLQGHNTCYPIQIVRWGRQPSVALSSPARSTSFVFTLVGISLKISRYSSSTAP